MYPSPSTSSKRGLRTSTPGGPIPKFDDVPTVPNRKALAECADTVFRDCAPKFDPVEWSVCATPAGVEALRFEIGERGLVAHA